MVDRQLRRRGIRDPRVLAAIEKVPRHLFVPPELREEAYNDQPLPIGAEQTISQPYMVASMTELLELVPGDRALEIGAGSGYQTAILAELTARCTPSKSSRGLRLRPRNVSRAWVMRTPTCTQATAPWAGRRPRLTPRSWSRPRRPFCRRRWFNNWRTAAVWFCPLARRIPRRSSACGAGRDIATESLYACRFVPLLGRYGWREEDPRG